MPRRQWTDEEINTLVSMWPKASIISNRKHLAPHVLGNTRDGKTVTRKGACWKPRTTPRNSSIKPDPQDFDKAKRDYCRKHRINIARLGVRFERNGQLAAELYALSPARA